MKLTVTCWSFPYLKLDEIGGLAKVLGINAIDVGYFYASALDKPRLLDNPQAYGEELRQRLPVPVTNLFHLFGDSLVDRNLALPSNPQNLADVKSALSFARGIGAGSIFILPGMMNAGQSRSQAIARSAEALKPMVEAGQEAGVAVSIEPHVHGILESVAMVGDMLDRVPGLKLTLDPAHLVCLGNRQEEIETLIPHAAHIHLRQARAGSLQTKLEEGVINFPAFFGALRDGGYDGWLACEYVHQAYMNTLFEDVLSETVKMRDTFNQWAG
jgi:sugar phosphate isomerase/epimerase